MSRKVRSPLAHVIDLAAILPWPAGGLLALLVYWTLQDPVNPAGISQYFIPGLLIVLISFAHLRKLGNASIHALPSPMQDALARMSAHDFEKLVAEGFRREGFLVVRRTGTRHMGSVDLELFLGRDRYLVLCRRWRESIVDEQTVRELATAISAERAAGGFVVTSGKFSDEARKIAMGRSIRLIPADSLRRLIKKVTASSTGQVTISPVFSRRRHDRPPPACPKCGKLMMARTKKQGGSITQIDWGCTSFPACQGSRAL